MSAFYLIRSGTELQLYFLQKTRNLFILYCILGLLCPYGSCILWGYSSFFSYFKAHLKAIIANVGKLPNISRIRYLS